MIRKARNCCETCENLVCVPTTIGQLQHTECLKPTFLDTFKWAIRPVFPETVTVNHLLLVPNRCLPSLNQTATRAHHDQKFNHIQSSVNTYLYSFLPRTIPHWNDLCIPNLSTIDLETFKQSTTPTL